MPSSVIHNFEYDAQSRRLLVRFTSGRVYAYAGVPATLAAAFAAAPSEGQFFNARVRDRYPAVRVRATGQQ